jgi:arginase
MVALAPDRPRYRIAPVLEGLIDTALLPGSTVAPPCVSLLGVPTRFGTAYPGAELMPALLRQSRSFWRLRRWCAAQEPPVALHDAGDVPVPTRPWSDAGFPLREVDAVLAVAERQANTVAGLLRAGSVPLVVGGDCTTLLGTAAGLRRAGLEFGLVCFDAHGDFNTAATTPSGNLHGMTVAALTGRGDPALLALFERAVSVPAGRMALLGVRDLDPPEAVALRDAGVCPLDPAALRQCGLGAAGAQARATALAALDGWAPPAGFLLHLDVDVLDPSVAPGVGLPVAGGLTLPELEAVLAPLLASGRLLALELTEAAPLLDASGRTATLVEHLLQLLIPALARSRPALLAALCPPAA